MRYSCQLFGHFNRIPARLLGMLNTSDSLINWQIVQKRMVKEKLILVDVNSDKILIIIMQTIRSIPQHIISQVEVTFFFFTSVFYDLWFSSYIFSRLLTESHNLSHNQFLETPMIVLNIFAYSAMDIQVHKDKLQ